VGRSHIVDPRMLEALHRFYPTTCTIQRDSGTSQSGSGMPVKDWKDILADVPCSFGPQTGREIRRPGDTYVMATHRAALRGHFPEVTEKHRAVIGGKAYNILAVAHDSHEETTSLDLELVS